jgi:hypothetical protein
VWVKPPREQDMRRLRCCPGSSRVTTLSARTPKACLTMYSLSEASAWTPNAS